MSDPGDHDPETREVAIPERLARQIESRMAGREFDSVDDYVATAMAMVLREVERGDFDGDQGAAEVEGESGGESEVRDRLESLGYL